MQLLTVRIEKPGDTNFTLGQTHFIKTVEDVHEALAGAVGASGSGWPFARRLASA